MFLNYFALALILTVLVILFYTLIYLHELPYDAAKHRNHPHKEAIYVACWLSLFTLHAIWPLVFLWALSHKEPLATVPTQGDALADVATRFSRFEDRLQRLEEQQSKAKGSHAT